MTTKTITCEIPTDQADWELYENAGKMHSALTELANWMREEQKYRNTKSIKIDKLREKFYEIINNSGVGDLF
jgi:hypothetical protein